MTDMEYVRHIGTLYQMTLSLRDDSDYVVNQPQMDKLLAVLDFFKEAVKDMDGILEAVDLRPKEEHGGITATFLVFHIYEDKVQKFCDVMRECSAIGIDTKLDGSVRISCTVPNVFVHK